MVPQGQTAPSGYNTSLQCKEGIHLKLYGASRSQKFRSGMDIQYCIAFLPGSKIQQGTKCYCTKPLDSLYCHRRIQRDTSYTRIVLFHPGSIQMRSVSARGFRQCSNVPACTRGRQGWHCLDHRDSSSLQNNLRSARTVRCQRSTFQECTICRH
ncbi:hypothetical protein DPMN_185098 [Dreissena polymorpha]|uniref:Uncharacterized protein n=1 Tax=Dreissena polymorpha TaxID=45954 RepID=A0A9D4DKS2_DREPO|nr:hypothetical protein DPMN_185098 [Dreissena polymorpha]